jgi:hypothetical protein
VHDRLGLRTGPESPRSRRRGQCTGRGSSKRSCNARHEARSVGHKPGQGGEPRLQQPRPMVRVILSYRRPSLARPRASATTLPTRAVRRASNSLATCATTSHRPAAVAASRAFMRASVTASRSGSADGVQPNSTEFASEDGVRATGGPPTYREERFPAAPLRSIGRGCEGVGSRWARIRMVGRPAYR